MKLLINSERCQFESEKKRHLNVTHHFIIALYVTQVLHSASYMSFIHVNKGGKVIFAP